MPVMASGAAAGTITATLDYPYEVSDIQGFNLYHSTPESNATIVADISDPTARKWSGDVPGLVDGDNIFFMTAYDKQQESKHSNSTTLNPPPPAPDKLQLQVNINVNATVTVKTN